MPIYDDIAISTGAYANFSLAAALLRIAEIAPAAEILSMGRHSLLMPANARVVELSGLPFTRPRPVPALRVRQPLGAGTTGRRSTSTAATSTSPPSWARASTSSTPTCSAGSRGGTRAWSRRSRRSFEELAALQEEYGVTIAVENLPFVRHTHFRAPGDLDLRGLGLSLDVGPRGRHRYARRRGWRTVGTSSSTCTCTTTRGTSGGDQHLPLGRGVIDAAPVMELARAAGVMVVLEHKNEADVIESLRHLHERGLLDRAIR